MIQNRKQLRLTQQQAARFVQAIDELRRSPLEQNLHPLLRKAEIEALESQLDTLKGEIETYQATRALMRKSGSNVLGFSHFEPSPVPSPLRERATKSQTGREERRH